MYSNISTITKQYSLVSGLYPSLPPIAIAGSRHLFVMPSVTAPFITACISAGVPALNIGCALGVDQSLLNASIFGGLPVNFYSATGKLPFYSPLLTLTYTSPSNLSFSQQLATRTQRCVSASCMLVVFCKQGQLHGRGTQLAINTANKQRVPCIITKM